MSISLVPISTQEPFKNIPGLVNASLTIIKDAVNALLSGYDTGNNSIKLVNVSSVAAGTVAAAGISLYSSSTNTVLSVYQNVSNSNVLTVSLTTDGVATLKKVVVNGSAESSFGAALRVTGVLYADGGMECDGVLDLSKTNSAVKNKYLTKSLVDANTSTSPLDLGSHYIVFLNYYNGGSNLANSGAVKINTSTLREGQILRLHCLGSNGSGMKLYNGTNGNEIFAFIDPSTHDFNTISASTLPTFSPSTSPNNQSWLEVMWMNIGSGTYRLVVLNSKLVSGVS